MQSGFAPGSPKLLPGDVLLLCVKSPDLSTPRFCVALSWHIIPGAQVNRYEPLKGGVMAKETPDHTVLFPIRRTRHIGDFICWKNHDAYQEAFERLLRDLKAESAAASE